MLIRKLLLICLFTLLPLPLMASSCNQNQGADKPEKTLIEIALDELEELGIIYDKSSMTLTTEESEGNFIVFVQRNEFTLGGGHEVILDKSSGDVVSIRHSQ